MTSLGWASPQSSVARTILVPYPMPLKRKNKNRMQENLKQPSESD